MERKEEQKRREAERLKSRLASRGGGGDKERDRSGSSGRDDGVRLKGTFRGSEVDGGVTLTFEIYRERTNEV